MDEAQFADEVRAAVRETVRLQADAGVDVLNDGEMSKPSYATYVKDRLTGFGGQGSIEQVAASVMALEDFPDFAEKRPRPWPRPRRSGSPPATGRSSMSGRPPCSPTSTS